MNLKKMIIEGGERMKRANKELVIRSFCALIGVAILSIGVATLRIGNVGLDPYTAANVGISNVLGTSLGVYQLAVNLFILVFVFLFGRKYIGVGTIINMVLTGFFIDFFTWIYLDIIKFNVTNTSRIVLLVVGIIIFTFGASFYMSAKLGNAPYDAIAPIIVDYTNYQYRTIRIIQDVSFVIIALIFSGPVGIGTVINAFFTGPLIEFWNQKVSQPFIEKRVKANI